MIIIVFKGNSNCKKINREKLQASNYHMFFQIIQIDYNLSSILNIYLVLYWLLHRFNVFFKFPSCLTTHSKHLTLKGRHLSDCFHTFPAETTMESFISRIRHEKAPAEAES